MRKRKAIERARVPRCTEGDPDAIVIRKAGAGRPGFAYEDVLREYYRAGADEWYLWWGNAQLSREGGSLKAGLRSIHPYLARAYASIVGDVPDIKAVASATNAPQRARMERLRKQLHLLFAALAGGRDPVVLALSPASARGTGSREANPLSVRERLRICLVGPLAPPSGGMATQLAQVSTLLRDEGHAVEVVANNAPCRPAWLEKVRGAERCSVSIHTFSGYGSRRGATMSSMCLRIPGWAWWLFAVPAVLIARWRRTP